MRNKESEIYEKQFSRAFMIIQTIKIQYIFL